jgi:hypothetical protein
MLENVPPQPIERVRRSPSRLPRKNITEEMSHFVRHDRILVTLRSEATKGLLSSMGEVRRGSFDPFD